MSDLILLKFDDTYGAQSAMNAVRALTELKYAWIDDVAIVERHKSGRVSTHTTHGSVTGGALWGGLLGMLIGLLWPPTMFLALWGIGMGTGALVEKLSKETGLDKEMLDEIRGSLDKGTSALLLLGASGDVDQMAKAFADYNPTDVIRKEMPEKAIANLKEALENAPEAAE
ncbi:MAG: DUF1269 domain-containing protein [Acidimicrobiales bacterium]|nr:DUF1269 domain-containing protein [Acidimicrobiales bacterium]MCB1259143.1 DUF1269 domain-containing protein [Acidimicrobiales bacterium]